MDFMSRFFCWILVLLLVGVFGAVATATLRERIAAGKGMPDYSVYSDQGAGLGEAANVLRQLGWTPVAVTRPVQQIRHRGLLILTEPERRGLLADEGSLSEADAKALLRWVEQGNTLLFSARTNTVLHEILHLVVTEEASGDQDLFTVVDLGAAGGYTEGVERLSVGSRASFQAGAEGLPLWWVRNRIGALLLRWGQGRVLVVADPGLLTRRGLVGPTGQPRDDNVLFLVNVASLDARDGKVYFDEYHHGLQSGGGFWSYLGYHGQKGALLPLFVLLAIVGWAWAVRLGPARPVAQKSRADAVDYASALARLYQRAGARRLLARTLVRGFLGNLTRHLHLRRIALPAVILAAWRRQTPGPSAERLQTLLRGVTELRKGDVGEHQLLSWTRAFDEFTREQLDV
jgi:hypothetical protein